MIWQKIFRKKSAPASQERRKDPRMSEENRVLIELIPEDAPSIEKKVCYAITKDTSAGGVKVLTDILFPVDSRLKIKLSLPGSDKTFSATGKIRWGKAVEEEDKFEMGVEFLQSPPEDFLSLLEHIYKSR